MLNMVFDPASGLVRNDKLDVSWLQAQIVTVGTQSQDFQLTTTFYQSNAANANTFYWSAGKLIHYVISDNGGIWNIQADHATGLDPTKAYYIYVKCDKFSPGGQIIISESQIAFDSVSDYYHFWVGVLSSVTDGLRDTIALYGITEISGKRIRAGEFVNTANQPVLDLDTRTFYGSFKFSSGVDVGQAINDANSTAQGAQTTANTANQNASSAGFYIPWDIEQSK